MANKQYMKVQGNLAAQREMELNKAFSKGKAGKFDNPKPQLPYKSPETGIDSKFGPGDKVCG